jgi:predicted O-linked N-acetylglucosamine transferase (SPINDLY family)
MAQHDRLDVALDPVGGHGGGTSTCDALWMGVPIIHLLGDHVGSRFSASLLNAIGHTEWIAHSEDEYVEKVIELARNVELRKQLRFSQRNIMTLSPLCDAQDLACSLEEAYSSMFKHWLNAQTIYNSAM